MPVLKSLNYYNTGPNHEPRGMSDSLIKPDQIGLWIQRQCLLSRNSTKAVTNKKIKCNNGRMKELQ